MQEFPVDLVRGGRALPPKGQRPREEAEWGEGDDDGRGRGGFGWRGEQKERLCKRKMECRRAKIRERQRQWTHREKNTDNEAETQIERSSKPQTETCAGATERRDKGEAEEKEGKHTFRERREATSRQTEEPWGLQAAGPKPVRCLRSHRTPFPITGWQQPCWQGPLLWLCLRGKREACRGQFITL